MSQERPKLLVVEDQPAVRAFVVDLLQAELGAVVSAAETKAQAMQRLQQESWDALITDMALPDGDMLDALDHLQQAGVLLPPTVLMSGFLSAERMAKAAHLGIAHVLAKPFQPETLVRCVGQVLGKSDAPRPQSAAPQAAPLAPELFEMDRKMGLVFRILHELPQQADLAALARNALRFALEISGASAALLVLAERAQSVFVRVGELGAPKAAERASIAATPLAALLEGHEEALAIPAGKAWPGIAPDVPAVAFPVTMQQRPVGALVLLGCKETPAEALQLISLLLRELDTLLDNRAVHAALAESMKETLIALVRALEARDRYTKDHSRRVGELAGKIAREMGLDASMIALVRLGGLLHDIGKVGIPDAVLLKPGRYTEREFAIMKAHPAIGDAILRHLELLVQERMVVRHHHERFDGRGYPDKLAGDEIPLAARIVCVADAIDAMTTHRVYRRAQPLSFAREQLERNAGTQFDPEVVKAAIALIDRGEVRTQAEDGEIEPLLPFSARILLQES